MGRVMEGNCSAGEGSVWSDGKAMESSSGGCTTLNVLMLPNDSL